MTGGRAAALVIASSLGLLLEAAHPPELRISSQGPDLLAATALTAAARPAGSIVAATLLGALRDGLSGGVAGRFALGYLAAALLARAALARVRVRRLRDVCAATLLGTLFAHALAGALAAALGRAPLEGVLPAAAAAALLTALVTPAVAVPMAAIETWSGEEVVKVDLGGARAH